MVDPKQLDAARRREERFWQLAAEIEAGGGDEEAIAAEMQRLHDEDVEYADGVVTEINANLAARRDAVRANIEARYPAGDPRREAVQRIIDRTLDETGDDDE
jgi:hypothetical protein